MWISTAALSLKMRKGWLTAMTSATLAEELVLLAYDDETGRPSVSRIALDLGLAAAILVELMLRDRIVADGGLRVVDRTPTGEPVLDEVLARVGADAPHPVMSWLQRLRLGVRDLVLKSLVQRGVIRDQAVTALEYIPLHRYPTVDPSSEARTRARLAEALTGASIPDERTAALATLVAGVRMTPTLGLTGDAVAEAHQRLEEIAANAGFAAGTILEHSTVRPSIALLVGELCRAVEAALGPVRTRPAG